MFNRLVFLFALATLGVGVAHAGCSAAARQYIQQGAERADQIDQASRDKALEAIVRQPPPGIMDAGGINECVGAKWPGIPGTTQAVLAGLGRQVVNQLCQQARQRIASAIPSYLRNVYSTVQRAQSQIQGQARPYEAYGSTVEQVAQGQVPQVQIPQGIVPPITSPGSSASASGALDGLFGPRH